MSERRDPGGAPTLVFIFGPPAVGKMTVGRELAARTGLRLFHNHHTIEPVLEFFPFGSPPFVRLVREFRRRVFEEVAASDLPGLIFTFVLAFDEPSDHETVATLSSIFATRGGRVLHVELQATQEERLRRNETELRLAEKPSKRDVAASRARLLDNDATYRLNSTGEYDAREDWLRLDNTLLSAADAAERIIAHYGLQTMTSEEGTEHGDT